MKIVINKSFGGFGLSKKAVEFMAERGNKQAKAGLEYIIQSEDNSDNYCGYSEEFESGYDRTDPDLVLAVEVLKDKANGRFAKLKVVEIPDGIEWEISEFDGMEIVHEKHRIWS